MSDMFEVPGTRLTEMTDTITALRAQLAETQARAEEARASASQEYRWRVDQWHRAETYRARALALLRQAKDWRNISRLDAQSVMDAIRSREAAEARAERAEVLLATVAGIVTRMSNYRQNNTRNFQLEKFDDFIRALERKLFASAFSALAGLPGGEKGDKK